MIEGFTLSPDNVGYIKKMYSSIKNLVEERKSLSEDIREEKKECSKKTNIPVKDLNGIVKVIQAIEAGNYSEEYVLIARAIEGNDVSET